MPSSRKYGNNSEPQARNTPTNRQREQHTDEPAAAQHTDKPAAAQHTDKPTAAQHNGNQDRDNSPGAKIYSHAK